MFDQLLILINQAIGSQTWQLHFPSEFIIRLSDAIKVISFRLFTLAMFGVKSPARNLNAAAIQMEFTARLKRSRNFNENHLRGWSQRDEF